MPDIDWINDISIRRIVARSLGGSLLILHGPCSHLQVLIQQGNIISWRRLHIAVKHTQAETQLHWMFTLISSWMSYLHWTKTKTLVTVISYQVYTVIVSAHKNTFNFFVVLRLSFDFRCSTSSLHSGLMQSHVWIDGSGIDQSKATPVDRPHLPEKLHSFKVQLYIYIKENKSPGIVIQIHVTAC